MMLVCGRGSTAMESQDGLHESAFDQACRFIISVGKAAHSYGSTTSQIETYLAHLVAALGYEGTLRATPTSWWLPRSLSACWSVTASYRQKTTCKSFCLKKDNTTLPNYERINRMSTNPVPSEVTLFKNVNIFDGTNEKLLEGYDVLVIENKIREIRQGIPTSGTYEIDVKAGGFKKADLPQGVYGHDHGFDVMVYEEEKLVKKQVTVNVIDGKGRTLMPGLIDSHWHCLLAAITQKDLEMEEADYLFAAMTAEAEKTLLRGFTTLRDIGGVSFGLKKAIDQGIVPGPRILPSGAAISQTSGHMDYHKTYELPRKLGGPEPRGEQLGMFRVADGVDEVLSAVRHNLKGGASQIKLAAGGGAASHYDPLDTNQYTFEEMKAAVDAASDWNTYVAVHIFNAKGIIRALEAGVKSIEHGNLIDEEAAKLMAEKGAWFIMNPFFKDEPGSETLAPESLKKFHQIVDGVETAVELVKKYNIKMGFGTDLLFSPAANGRQADLLVRYGKWFSNVELLRMITSVNAELLEMSGPRHPYREGKLGVIAEGAYADIILVDGNPLEDPSLLGDNARNIPLIMKDGKIYKDEL
jgi:imidazolonepropionase-like amidohydrolase